MMRSPASELAKITYLDPSVFDGRALLLMPFWDGEKWHLWFPTEQGTVRQLQVIDALHANYVAKEAASLDDIWIQFVDLMWQRANWPEVGRTIQGIDNYFHLLATSVAKLRHFFEARETIGQGLISSFVQTELEYLITVARSVFDLLQETLATIWSQRVRLIDPAGEAIRKQRKMPDSFTKMATNERKTPKSPEEIMSRYALPEVVAAQYHRYSPFFISLLEARDKIVHSGGNGDTVFVTDQGFCVNPKAKTFKDFPWQEEHHFNDSVVSLLPWVAHVVFGSIQACNDIMDSFASVIELMPEMAPGYRVFIRDPASSSFRELAEVAAGERIWWSDTKQADS